MASKALVQRQKQVDHLVALTHTHAERVSKILTVQARKGRYPGRIPDLLNLQCFQAHWLGKSYGALKEAEASYLLEKDRTGILRNQRDELTARLYEQVVAVRGFLERIYGKNASIRLTGLEGKTPRDPHDLAQAGLTVVERLRAEGQELPEPRFEGVEFHPEKTAAALERLARSVADTLEALARHHRRVELLMLERNEARAQLDEMLTGTQEMLEGLYVAAGLRHLVPGIRTSGASVKNALRETPRSSLERAWRFLAEADRQKTGSHPVRRRDPVEEVGNCAISADFRPVQAGKSQTIPASSFPDSASPPVRARHLMDDFISWGSVLPFERSKPLSHPVRRRKSGESVPWGGRKGESGPVEAG